MEQAHMRCWCEREVGSSDPRGEMVAFDGLHSPQPQIGCQPPATLSRARGYADHSYAYGVPQPHEVFG
jgi:hypothetical protein